MILGHVPSAEDGATLRAYFQTCSELAPLHRDVVPREGEGGAVREGLWVALGRVQDVCTHMVSLHKRANHLTC